MGAVEREEGEGGWRGETDSTSSLALSSFGVLTTARNNLLLPGHWRVQSQYWLLVAYELSKTPGSASRKPSPQAGAVSNRNLHTCACVRN